MEVVMETERLMIRKYALDDVYELYSIIGDAETMKYYKHPYSLNDTNRWIEWNLDNYRRYGFGLWALVLKENKKFIGDCGVTMQNINGQMVPEIGYHIHKDYHQQGLATEAGKAVLDYFFKNFKFNEIFCYQTKDNIPSQKTALKLGLSYAFDFSDNGEINTVYNMSK